MSWTFEEFGFISWQAEEVFSWEILDFYTVDVEDSGRPEFYTV